MIPKIDIRDFSYDLPDDKIAKYPLKNRDDSKLLVFEDDSIKETVFSRLPCFINENSLIIFNDTKVVPARMQFVKSGGASIEIFCLKPVSPAEYNMAFSAKGSCVWECMVGNVKKWKGETIKFDDKTGKAGFVGLEAELLSKNGNSSVVKFSWSGDLNFSEVMEICGCIPIPPYLNRDTESIDIRRYQTLYAKIKGSVAAPTAGLHFSDGVLEELEQKGVEKSSICLHVGAGTFLPVKNSDVSMHEMHGEPFIVNIDLIKQIRKRDRQIVVVGTTSTRTLESLYYAGVSCLEKGCVEEIAQWVPYERDYEYSTEEALDALIGHMEKNNIENLSLSTKIIIVPSFKFRIADALITNFHQPESTLILLVSAFLNGNWRKVYDYALTHDFRFLSYGDSSLLFRSKDI